MGDSAVFLILVVGAVICAYRAMTELRLAHVDSNQ